MHDSPVEILKSVKDEIQKKRIESKIASRSPCQFFNYKTTNSL